MNAPVPTDAQLDALKEVANIGCGHAANALARLMGGQTVHVSVPRAQSVGAAELSPLLGGPDSAVVSARLHVQGALEGLLLLVLPAQDAQVLQHALIGDDHSPEERESVLEETANILASACLSAIGNLTGWTLMPSVPCIERGLARDTLASALRSVKGGTTQAMALEACFSSHSVPPVSGQLLFLLEPASATKLLARLGL